MREPTSMYARDQSPEILPSVPGNDRKPLFRNVMWTVRESQKNLREAEERIMDSRDWG